MSGTDRAGAATITLSPIELSFLAWGLEERVEWPEPLSGLTVPCDDDARLQFAGYGLQALKARELADVGDQGFMLDPRLVAIASALIGAVHVVTIIAGSAPVSAIRIVESSEWRLIVTPVGMGASRIAVVDHSIDSRPALEGLLGWLMPKPESGAAVTMLVRADQRTHSRRTIALEVGSEGVRRVKAEGFEAASELVGPFESALPAVVESLLG